MGHGKCGGEYRYGARVPDGDTLRWLVIDEPAPARVECRRTARRDRCRARQPLESLLDAHAAV
jgi:hypothetical protein